MNIKLQAIALFEGSTVSVRRGCEMWERAPPENTSQHKHPGKKLFLNKPSFDTGAGCLLEAASGSLQQQEETLIVVYFSAPPPSAFLVLLSMQPPLMYI